MEDKQERPATDIFQVERIRELVEMMKEHELTALDLRDGRQRVSLRRGGGPPAANSVAPVAVPAPPAAAPPSSEAPAPPAADENVVLIRSPMVGTFYAKPNPDSAPFVKVGDTVSPDTIVCMVEAMKTFNELPAGVSGKIVAVLVENEEPVDHNKPLFKVDPNG